LGLLQEGHAGVQRDDAGAAAPKQSRAEFAFQPAYLLAEVRRHQASMIDLSNTVVQRVRVERDFGITDRYCKSQELGLQRGPLRTFTLSISPP
jgi:hypothetical protein